jgi:drug/metabolite transporter (DMT)-like permease
MRANNVLPKLGEPAMLMALPPVIILPVSYFAFKEKFGWQAIVGTVLAISGVALLFLA